MLGSHGIFTNYRELYSNRVSRCSSLREMEQTTKNNRVTYT